MNVLLILLVTVIFFLFAYKIYGRYIARVFKENDLNPTPAKSMADGLDYVASNTLVVFSHHFSSIAGGGPIIGPTVALLYGFYPTWLWIIIGGIFIGAVHDYTSLFVSVREKGRSMAEIARKTMGNAGFVLFILFTLFLVVVVCAAFLGLTATALTSIVPVKTLQIPEGQALLRTMPDPKTGELRVAIGGVASSSVIVITFFAPILGWLIVKRGMRVLPSALIAIAVAFGSVIIGLLYPVRLSPEVWMVLLSVYCFFASAVPVWIILQPRDFINSFILYGGLFALLAGIIAGGLSGITLNAPAFNIGGGEAKLGPIWPILFITVACGAISGFHSLVAGGTTSKQVQKESDVKKIGYGGMLLESLLAAAVLITVATGLSFTDYTSIVFPDPKIGKSNPVLAFSLGTGLLLQKTLGIAVYIGTIFGIVMVEGFLATTLDTSVRLGRYLLEELWKVIYRDVPLVLRSHYFNSAIIVIVMFMLAYKQGFLLIWPIFGSANQLLASLALIAVSVWLVGRARKNLFALLPAGFMIITTITSLVYLLFTKYIPGHNQTLSVFAIALVVLACGVAALAIKNLSEYRNGAKEVIRDPLVQD